MIGRSLRVGMVGAALLAGIVGAPLRAGAVEEPPPTPPACTLNIGAIVRPTLNVTSGQVACLAGTTVNGSISVAPGGAVILNGGYVAGSITSVKATFVWVCSTTVRGSITAQSPTGFVRIGDAANDDGLGCGGNNIRGSVSILSGMGGFEIGGNQIFSNVTVNDNVGNGHVETEYEIEGNVIGGSLTCLRNRPVPSDDGKPNSVAGTLNCAMTDGEIVT